MKSNFWTYVGFIAVIAFFTVVAVVLTLIVTGALSPQSQSEITVIITESG